VLSTDGALALRRSASAPLTDRAAAAHLGTQLAHELLDDGADQLDSAPGTQNSTVPTAGSTEVHNA
jgi:hypothetical protein